MIRQPKRASGEGVDQSSFSSFVIPSIIMHSADSTAPSAPGTNEYDAVLDDEDFAVGRIG